MSFLCFIFKIQFRDFRAIFFSPLGLARTEMPVLRPGRPGAPAAAPTCTGEPYPERVEEGLPAQKNRQARAAAATTTTTTLKKKPRKD